MEINKTMEQDLTKDNIDSQINTSKEQQEAERLKEIRRQAGDEAGNRMYWSERLQESKKSYGDSSLMRKVKADLANVEKSRSTEGVQKYTDDEFLTLFGNYFSAIDSCRKYLNERSATKGIGSERRTMVQKNLSHLIREVELLGQAKELLRAGALIGKGEENTDLTLDELLYRTRVCELGTLKGEKYASEKVITQEITDPGLKAVMSLFKPLSRKIKNKKEAAAYGRDVGELRRCLKEIPEGKSYTSYASLSGRQILISQDANGVVTISTKDASAVLNEGVFDLMRIIDSNMIEGSDMMNAKDLEDMIKDQRDYSFIVEGGNWNAHKNAGDIQRAGSRLARFLEIKTGKPATFFSNIDVPMLKMLSVLLIQGTKPSEIIKAVEENEKVNRLEGKRINTSETLDLVRQTIGKEEYVNEKIVFDQQQKRTEQIQDGWEDDERATRDLVADMVFSQDTWENDETTSEPGERMRRMLLAHKDAVATLIVDNYRQNQEDPSVLDRMIDKLPLNMAGLDGANLKSVLKEKVRRLNEIVENAIIKAYALELAFGNEDDADAHFMEMQELKHDKKKMTQLLERVLSPENSLEKAALFKELGDIESEMDSMIVDYSDQMQQKINDSLVEMETQRQQRENKNAVNVQQQEVLRTDANEKGIDKNEKKKRIQNGEKELKKIIEASMNGDSGQGKFTKIVFQNYFKDANILDKRSMFGSAIRGATPTSAPGKFFGDLLKGAGPLFQKLMQGLPVDGFDQDFRTALEDMKSKLAPIPERIVKAQLLGMVERSNGRISRIEVTRALGAASVGQTFLCKMYGKDLPKEGKDVVVKLLKPDVRNRMMREKNVMLRYAEATDTSGGMKATYLGQLSRIEEELDLTIEARNVVKGAIYDKTYNGTESDGVKSMELNSLVDPTVNSMVLEKAPGDTVDKYIKELDFTAQAIDTLLKRKDDEILPREVKRPLYNGKISKEEYEKKLQEYRDYVKTRNERNKKYRNRVMLHFEKYNRDITRALTRQKYMTSLADKWVSEGIFGEGFYHGDLHAGNIMIDDEGLTVIDFGNATTLDEHQQVQVTRMVAAAAVGDVSGFKKGLKNLLKPEFKKEFSDKEKRLTLELKKIFSLGDKNSAGLRIAVALLKAQELGLEVPSAIFNFSQCQLRLQNAIDETNAMIENLKKNYHKFDNALMAGFDDNMTLFETIIMNSGDSYMKGSDETGEEAVKRHFNSDRGLDKSLGIIKPELYKIDDSFIEKGTFYSTAFAGYVKEGQKPGEEAEFTPLDIVPDYKILMNNIFMQIEAFKHIPGRTLTDKYFDNWENQIGSLLGGISDFCDTESITAHIIAYIKNAASEDRLNYPNDADKDIAEYWKNIFVGHINKFKTIADSCKELERSIVSGEAIGEQAEDAKKQLNEKYTEFKLLRDMHRKDTPFGKLTSGLADKDKREMFGDIINEIASYDTELGTKLFEDYNKFKTYQDENPLELIEDSEQIKDVVVDIIKLTAIRIDSLYNDLNTIKKETPQSFVDVMGDTILRNLTVSLKRLGFFTSYKYNKVLGAED